MGKHVLGQLAPPGRLAERRTCEEVYTRVALQCDGTAVEVVGDLVGDVAYVVPLGGDLSSCEKVCAGPLRGVNCWRYEAWLQRLPRGAEVATEDVAPGLETMPSFAARLAMAPSRTMLRPQGPESGKE